MQPSTQHDNHPAQDSPILSVGAIGSLHAATIESLVGHGQREAVRTRAKSEVRPVQSVAVIGSGLMGTAIGATCLNAGLPVVLVDSDPQMLAKAPERIEAELALQHGTFDPASLKTTSQVSDIRGCDLVIESIVEDLAAKRRLLAELQSSLGEHSFVASNTSTIPIGRMAEGLPRASHFCGIHFFHPVRDRALVEIIRGPETSSVTLALAVEFAGAIQKMPIVVDDGPGFLVNRLLLPYLGEALELLLDGATIDQVEDAATQFGMPIGPLHVVDEIGLDTTMHAGHVLLEAFPDRVVPSPLMITMYKKGRLGRKVGKGFFRYAENGTSQGPAESDPEVDAIIASWARPPKHFTSEMIRRRLLLPMVLEATRLIEEGRVTGPRDIDLAIIFGLGFPQSRGGLLAWADSLGPRRILEMLKPLAHLGPRMQPPRLLLEMARENRLFYA